MADMWIANDGALDGVEDANQNGFVDAGETDPNVAGGPPPPTVSSCKDDADTAIRASRDYQKALRQAKRACTSKDINNASGYREA